MNIFIFIICLLTATLLLWYGKETSIVYVFPMVIAFVYFSRIFLHTFDIPEYQRTMISVMLMIIYGLGIRKLKQKLDF